MFKNKLFIFISLLIALVDASFVILNYSFSKKALHEEFSKQANIYSTTFKSAQKTAENNLLMVASIFAEDEEAVKLFAAGKYAVEKEGGGAGGKVSAEIRRKLYQLIGVRWELATERLGARQLHFHLGPGSLSFLRVHRPEKFGDRMDNIRFTIVDTNKEKSLRSGFETGRVYSGIRGVVPIASINPVTGKKEHIGALEAGISYKKLVHNMKETTGADVTILLTKDHVESVMWPAFIKNHFSKETECGCFIEASSSKIPASILKNAKRNNSDKFIKDGRSQLMTNGHEYYVATFFPLRDYLGTKDRKRQDVGAIVVWQNVTSQLVSFQKTQQFNVIYGILAYLFVEFLFIIGFRKAVQTLQHDKDLLTESEAQYRSLFENSSDAIMLLKNDQFIDCNRTTLTLFGCPTVKKFCQLRLCDLSPTVQSNGQNSIDFIKEKVQLAHENEGHLFEWIHQRYDNNEEFHSEVLLTPMALNGELFIQGVVRNISQRKEIELASEKAKQEAEMASRSKSEFLANMSHEIRTPMNAIIGMTHLALMSDLNEKQQHYISNAHDSAENLLSIINDILDFSKIESGKLDIEKIPFQLSTVIKNTLNVIKLRANEKHIKIFIDVGSDIPKSLLGDAFRISQILINLTNNAVKFTDNRGIVEVDVKLLSQTNTDALIQFSVKDTGIGISPEQQKKLFQSFSQADTSTTRQYGGTGLGLVISSQIVKLMNGKIWLESDLGKGSKFHFTINIEKQNNNDNLTKPSLESSPVLVEDSIKKLNGKKILLVEDDEINQELAIELLMMNGMKVSTANNGQEAVSLFSEQRVSEQRVNKQIVNEPVDNEHPFDLILMDCQMPIMDGYQATREIRKNEKYKSLPIIAMTANVMKQDIEKAKKSGMNDHIAKPVNPDTMFITMAKWII